MKRETNVNVKWTVIFAVELPGREYFRLARNDSGHESQHPEHPLEQERHRSVSRSGFHTPRFRTGPSSALEPRGVLVRANSAQRKPARSCGHGSHLRSPQIRREGTTLVLQRPEDAHDRDGQVHSETWVNRKKSFAWATKFFVFSS